MTELPFDVGDVSVADATSERRPYAVHEGGMVLRRRASDGSMRRMTFGSRDGAYAALAGIEVYHPDARVAEPEDPSNCVFTWHPLDEFDIATLGAADWMALVERHEKEAWVCDRVAETLVDQHGAPDEGEAARYRRMADHHRARARLFKSFAAEEERRQSAWEAAQPDANPNEETQVR